MKEERNERTKEITKKGNKVKKRKNERTNEQK